MRNETEWRKCVRSERRLKEGKGCRKGGKESAEGTKGGRKLGGREGWKRKRMCEGKEIINGIKKRGLVRIQEG